MKQTVLSCMPADDAIVKVYIMPSALDQRRLSTGAQAPTSLSDDPDELASQIEQLGDSLRALQSLDSLGSVEANNIAISNADAVLAQLKKAESKLAELTKS